MRNITKNVSWAVVIALSMTASREARAEVIIGNLDQPGGGFTQVYSTRPVAQSFTIGGTSKSLGSVVVDLEFASSSFAGYAQLLQDNGSGDPNSATLVNTFSFPSSVTTGSGVDYTLTPTTTGEVLAANTTYYLVLGAQGSTQQFAYDWVTASSNSATAGSDGTVGMLYGGYQGTFSPEGVASNGYFEVLTPSSVPEPSSLAMMGLAGVIGSGFAWRRRKRSA